MGWHPVDASAMYQPQWGHTLHVPASHERIAVAVTPPRQHKELRLPWHWPYGEAVMPSLSEPVVVLQTPIRVEVEGLAPLLNPECRHDDDH